MELKITEKELKITEKITEKIRMELKITEDYRKGIKVIKDYINNKIFTYTVQYRKRH